MQKMKSKKMVAKSVVYNSPGGALRVNHQAKGPNMIINRNLRSKPKIAGL